MCLDLCILVGCYVFMVIFFWKNLGLYFFNFEEIMYKKKKEKVNDI